MNKTNRHNLEDRLDPGDEVLDYFETEAVLNLSALAREARINLHTLQARIRRASALSTTEIAALIAALKRFHLASVA